MRTLMVLLLCGVATGTFAQNRTIWKTDVETWLDGCLALAEATMHGPSQMELSCFDQAIRYCSMGRLKEEIPECQEGLLAKVQTESIEVRAEMEQMGANLSKNRRKFLARRLTYSEPDRADYYDCPIELTELECKLLSAGTRWLLLRGTQRVPWLNE